MTPDEANPETSIEDIFEIRDPAIDTSTIMSEIRGRIQERRALLNYDASQLPTFGAATEPPAEAEDLPPQPTLFHHLRLVNRTFNQVETTPTLASSPATRIPLIGRLWGLVREQAHQLVLFYVNRSVAHQTNVNRHLVSVNNELTRLLQEQQRRLDRLEEEVDALRQEAHRL